MKQLFGGVFVIIVLVVITFLGWQFRTWEQVTVALTPTQENLTELYFANHQDLPNTASPGATLKFAYTIHNVEHQPVTYPVEVSINNDPETATEEAEITAFKGTHVLQADEARTFPLELTMPEISTERYKITVALPSVRQKIHFWVVQAPFAHPLIDMMATESGQILFAE